jgi:TPP-dependent pyruvate/acetoin dehydrogenase alpha subunit
LLREHVVNGRFAADENGGGMQVVGGLGLDLFTRMTLCREFETTLIACASQDRQPIGHPYQGQEAVAAGICAAMTSEDRLLSTHRTHGHAVAVGCDLERLALELYGSGEGTCRGRAGEMYMSQVDVGYFGGTQIVAGNLAMGTGLALAAKLSGRDRIAIATVGDGGVNQGVFHEAVNLAAIWALPIVFVVENNGYAQTTATEYATAGRISERAAAYGIDAVVVDGQSALEVHGAVVTARRRAVAGAGPTLIEARTYRYEGHYYGDRHRRYRTQAEVEHWLARDPIALLRGELLGAGVAEDELSDITDSARQRCQAAFERARTGRTATRGDLLDGIFTDPRLNQLAIQ